MRLAVISDIHGNLPALQAVLADIERRGADEVINLGDCVTGPLWPRETFALLASRGFATVRGNHDRMLAELPAERLGASGRHAQGALTVAERATLGALPAAIAREDGILAVHGTPGDDSTYLTEEVVDGRLCPARREVLAERLGVHASHPVVLCGHSHRQSVTMGPRGCLIVNPGSVGCPVFAESPAAPGLEHRSPHARYAIVSRTGGTRKGGTRTGADWSVELHALCYDWTAAAQRAGEVGGARWAQSIATGLVDDGGPA